MQLTNAGDLIWTPDAMPFPGYELNPDTLEALQAAVERLEAGKTFDLTETADRVSSFFQDSVDQRADRADAADKILGTN